MAIQKEIWEDHIEGNLFKNNEFILASTDAGQFVLQGKVVHIPQAGATPNVEKNRSTLPADVTQRVDTDVTYSLDEFSTDPILIPNADTIELSYNKRESVLAESEAALRQSTAESILLNWAPDLAANIIRTTGSSVTTTLGSPTTGNRKRFTVQDLKNAQLQLNKQNVPLEDRYALLSADMFQQLTDDMTQTIYRDFSAAFDAKNGILGKLFGFHIMLRSSVLTYSNDTTPVVRTTGATAATDNDTVLCWHQHAVERALGNITFYEKIGDPLYYGDVYSISLHMGGRKRREDEKGIIAIVQDEA